MMQRTRRRWTLLGLVCFSSWACSGDPEALVRDASTESTDAARSQDATQDGGLENDSAHACPPVIFRLDSPLANTRVQAGSLLVQGVCDPAGSNEVSVTLAHADSGAQMENTTPCAAAQHPTDGCSSDSWGAFQYTFETDSFPSGASVVSARQSDQLIERDIVLVAPPGTVRAVSDGTLLDHADGSVPGTIQAALDASEPGDEVQLTSTGPFSVLSTLQMRSGVRLTSTVVTEDKTELPRVLAAPGFEGPEMMMIAGGPEDSPTTVSRLHFDGAHIAWRIVGFETPCSNVVIEQSLFQRTKNDIGYPAETGFHHVDILFGVRVHNLRIYENELRYAGVKEGVGRENNPLTWSAIGAGIILYNSSSLDIGHNLVREVSTHGISVAGSRQVHIYNNRMDYVARNIEWWDVSEVPLPLGDGITGYHNNGFTDVTLYESQDWLIEDNDVYHSGNHGIHVGGKGIEIRGGNIRFANQTGILLGDHRVADGGTECSQNTRVQGVRVRDPGSTGYLYRTPDRSLLPASLTQSIAVRGYERHRATLEFVGVDILDEVYFDSRFESCMVE